MIYAGTHIVYLATVLSLYTIISLCYYGWGRLGTFILKLDVRTIQSPFTITWLGLAIAISLLQLLHLFFPLDWRTSLLIYGCGGVLSLPGLLGRFKKHNEMPSLYRLLYGFVIVIVASWIASRSMLPPVNYDSGLYHFNTIRWINSFPIIPGLGNLHGRLAFNQSFFTYAASLNFFPYFPYSRGIANSFLFLLVFSQVTWRLFEVLWRRRCDIEKLAPLDYLPHLFTLPVLVFLALRSNVGLDSPTPDLASTLMQLSMFIMLAQIVSDIKTRNWMDARAMILMVLAITAITIKFSNFGVSMTILCICLICLLIFSPNKHLMFNRLVRLALVIGVIIITWMVRGYILSGYPLYPSTLGAITFEWSVPLETTQNMANTIYSWAREPGVPASKVFENWDWLGPWFARMILKVEDVMYPTISAILAMAVFAASFIYARSHNRPLPRLFELVLLAPPALGLVFWFFTAPDPRFAHGLFWLLSISSVVVLLSYAHSLFPRQIFVLSVCVALVVTNTGIVESSLKKLHNTCSVKVYSRHPDAANNDQEQRVVGNFVSNNANNESGREPNVNFDKRMWGISISGFHTIPFSPLIQKKSLSGLIVYTPAEGDQCWDSPIPSTPYLNPNLRLRVPGRTESGFTVK